MEETFVPFYFRFLLSIGDQKAKIFLFFFFFTIV